MSEPRPRKPSVIKRRFPWGWVVLGLLGAGALVAMLAARGGPVAVSVSAPTVFKAGERNPLVTASGYLVARTRATLSSKVLGRVSWLGVQEGSRVTKGQILARLESPDLAASRDQVQAQLDQAKVDLDRAEKLRALGIQDVATVDRLRSQKLTLEAQLAYQDALLESMALKAPFSGVVTQKLSEVGETVAPGSAGGANAINAILVMADFDTLEVEVEVNEASIAKLQRGMPAEIRVDALDGQGQRSVLKGRLREIYPSSNRQKAVVIVRVAFVEKDPLLVPDMGAKVTFLGEAYAQDVLVLGREQLKKEDGKPFVWTVENGAAVQKFVTVKAENPIGLEVDGLAKDAMLIVAPPESLKPGAKVRVKQG
ncbi:MAG: efflux RND transporter periplasmic adaptor subunit [Geothrix sp.]|uniref:Efflux RND transporter periplasmic adaptor subunit n=1 Tax=Candidatus Geothrix odensensis TaxID=2954440 RepID=A0A936K6E6_9BACT|nr:efflux RND transporter periplasmic adaptor subunit [Candidatus Geothrix odensensis]MCC6513936.1 efflux RND transporter periplasmic adaptor subunit [Geothrix sp.]